MYSQDIVQMLTLENDSINSQIIKDLLDEYGTKNVNMKTMYDRYAGDVPILNREFEDKTKVNSKLANDYRGVIIDTNNGYFLGNDITYNIDSQAYTESDLKIIDDELKSFKYRNDIADLDSTTGEYASVCGYGARLCYIDLEGNERVMNVKPWEVIFVYDPTIDDVQYALIYYKIIEQIGERKYERTKVEWYDNKNVTFYVSNDGGDYVLDASEKKNPKPHMFDYVPVIKFKNNNLEKGDFEKVESLIDGYDRNLSDVQNEIEEFRLAYMAFYGIEPTPADIKAFRLTGGISFPEDTDAKFITKDLNGAVNFIENHKDTLNENIYKFSKTVDMSDDSFAGTSQSGESRKWKLQPLENNTITKEKKFIKGLRQMFRIIGSAWQKKNINFNYETMSFQFKRNIPIDMSFEADVTNKLKGNVSEETRLSLLSCVTDVNTEIEKMKEDNVSDVNLTDVSLN